MTTSRLRRYFALVLLVLLPVIGIRAEDFYGPTTIDFRARGYGTYNMWFTADLIVGGSAYASAYASFGGLYGSSYSYIGEAGVGMYLYDIERINGVWVAGSAIVYAFSNDTGQYEYTYYYNFPLPTVATVYGSAECEGYRENVRGYIYGYGPPPNDPPVPSIAVVGRNSGAMVPANTVITANYGATDPNGNLSGIRYNVWYATEGIYDNGSGSYVPKSGRSGLVTKSFTLASSGYWYFWTEAMDVPGAYASTSAWGSGFQIFVRWGTPCYEPAFWNGSNNNCYNYANNRRTDTFAQPGNGGGTTFNLNSQDLNQVKQELRAAAIADGLEETYVSGTSATGKTKVALVLWPQHDYHWYRQDCTGQWTHKPGDGDATNLDNSGNIISSPEAASRGNYTEFVGYFFTPSDAVQGQGHANIY